MTCEEIRALMESARSDARIREHVVSCDACASYAATLGDQNAQLARALKPRSDDVRFERIKRGLADRIDRSQRPARTRWIIFAASAAAMVAIGFGAYRFYSPAAVETPPEIARSENSGDVFAQVAELQSKVRRTQVLDELAQLQVALDGPDDADGKSAAEDAELYIERILSLSGRNEQAFRETLAGVDRSGITARLKKLRSSLPSDAPAQAVQSLALAISTFDEAGRISQSTLAAHAKKEEVAYAD